MDPDTPPLVPVPLVPVPLVPAQFVSVPLVVVMGVAGSGKSSVATLLADRLGAAFAEGDGFHSPANVAKMSAGQPLTDEDRWPWLARIRDWLAEQRQAGRAAVVPCSALRRAYRDILREAGPVRFVHLTGTRELLTERIEGRAGHFMRAEMLDSQLDTLEPLAADEPGITLDVAARPAELTESVLDYLGAGQASVVPNASPSR